MEEYNYQKDLEINKYALDEECLDQPRRFAYWAELRANVILERDSLKQKVAVVRAQTEIEIRGSSDEEKKRLGITKGTEGDIKAVLEINYKVQMAEQDYLEACHKVNILSVAKESFQDRKERLGDLVSLWISSYWSDPKLPKRGDKIDENIQNKINKSLQENPRLRKGN